MRRHKKSKGNGNSHDFNEQYQNPELVSDQWIKSAEQDLMVADTLFDAGHYSWSAFACQQAIEKLLKAGYVRSRHKIPPHVHDLARLSAIMKLDPPEEYINNLLEIDQCYTSTRYPGYKHGLCVKGKEESESILDKTWRTYGWLRHELQL